MVRLFALLALPALLASTAPLASAIADGCYMCTRGSACGQYCRYAGRDSWAKRKKCIEAGCKIGGTASCPTAANVRICSGIGMLRSDRQYAQNPNPRPGLNVPWPTRFSSDGPGKICLPF